jgi:hypothetical protein
MLLAREYRESSFAASMPVRRYARPGLAGDFVNDIVVQSKIGFALTAP